MWPIGSNPNTPQARAGRRNNSQKEKSVLPQEVEHWSLTTLHTKPVKIGAKVVRHGRYVTFQLAEARYPVLCLPTSYS